MNEAMIGKVKEEEVRKVVFSMNQYKAPSPNGFPLDLFQEFQDIVNYTMFHLVNDFGKTSKLLKELNQTFIVLIAKMEGPRYLKDFRPISLCNTIYKVLAKIMVIRIKLLLDKFIKLNQNGVVIGLQILDAIITMHEVSHSMEICQNLGMALKLDISKAYEKLWRKFLFDIITKLGFNENFIKIIRTDVNIVTFSILVNGVSSRFFSSSQDL